MIITVKEIGQVSEEKKGTRSWYTLPVKYQDDRGGEKEKKFKSFDALWPQVKKIVVGKSYDVSLKKDGDYWVWTDLKEVAGGGGSPQRASAVSTGRDFESKEERALRQRLIVNQSSLTTAIEMFKVLGTTPNSVEEIYDLASNVRDWVFENNSQQREPEVD